MSSPKVYPASGVQFDPDVFKANMKALRKRYPRYVKTIEDTRVTDRFGLTLWENREPNLWVKSPETGEYEPFHNPDSSPRLDGKRSYDEQRRPYCRSLVFLGIGIAYQLQAFAEDPENSETHSIIVFENDLELFKVVMGVMDISAVLAKQNAHFFLGLEEDGAYSELWNYAMDKQWLILHARSLHYIFDVKSMQLHRQYYMHMVRSLNMALAQGLHFFGNCPHDSLVGIVNMLANLDNIIKRPGVNLLFERFKGVPAVIAATGPSLEKQLPLLREIQDKALILCPESSLGPLLNAGIRPHFACSLERIDNVIRLIEQHDFGDDINLAAVPVVLPDVYETCNGRSWICYRIHKHFNWTEIDRGQLYIKGSAANMGYNLATAFGCDPIVLIGQDLAYGDGGQTHATGMVLGSHQDVYLPQKRKDLKEVPGYYGGTVQSNMIWELFLNHYKTDIAENNARGLTTFNSTEGGVRIPGAQQKPFAELIQEQIAGRESRDFAAEIRAQADQFAPDIQAEREKVRAKLDEAIDLCDECIEENIEQMQYAEQILDQYRDYVQDLCGLDAYNPEDIRTQYKDLEKRRVATRVKGPVFIALILHVIQPYMIKFESEYSNMPEAFDDPIEGMLTAILTSAVYYENVIDIIRILQQNLCGARDELFD